MGWSATLRNFDADCGKVRFVKGSDLHHDSTFTPLHTLVLFISMVNRDGDLKLPLNLNFHIKNMTALVKRDNSYHNFVHVTKLMMSPINFTCRGKSPMLVSNIYHISKLSNWKGFPSPKRNLASKVRITLQQWQFRHFLSAIWLVHGQL